MTKEATCSECGVSISEHGANWCLPGAGPEPNIKRSRLDAAARRRTYRNAVNGFSFREAVLEDAKEKLRIIRDEPQFELLLPSEADELLRALGEMP